jgi:hypothetical protein
LSAGDLRQEGFLLAATQRGDGVGGEVFPTDTGQVVDQLVLNVALFADEAHSPSLFNECSIERYGKKQLQLCYNNKAEFNLPIMTANILLILERW